jgi:hypothetical protein
MVAAVASRYADVADARTEKVEADSVSPEARGGREPKALEITIRVATAAARR